MSTSARKSMTRSAGGAPTPVIGPHAGSLFWNYAGDLRFMLVVGYVAVLQEMHPAFSSISMQNSLFFSDVWRRWFERTMGPIMRSVYAENPAAVSRRIRNRHNKLAGVDEQGRSWRALDPQVFHWAHATTVYAYARMLELYVFGRPLSPAENEAFYQDTRLWWRQYGVGEVDVTPRDWPSFLSWYEDFSREHCVDTPGVRTMVDFLRSAPPPPLPEGIRGHWASRTKGAYEGYVWSQTALLSPVHRERLGLDPWTVEDEQRLRRFAGRVRLTCNHVPRTVLLHPDARAAFRREDTSLRGRLRYGVGESLHRPVTTLWSTLSRTFPDQP
jgi:uncharacterized protein (DUF2236 family)